jgi:DNA-binding GntR family transcriptional regulator
MLTLRLRPKPVTSNADHLALVEAIERGDAEGARRIHREHRVRHGRMLVEILRTYGLTQL